MTKPNNRGKGQVSDERLALLGQCIADGWSKSQIIQTYGFSWKTIKHYHPDYSGLSQVEGAKLGAAARHAFYIMNHA